VEEAAAAAESLQEQSGQLAGVVSVFKLDGVQAAHAAPARTAVRPRMAPSPRPAPSRARPVLRAVPSGREPQPKEDDWEVF